MERRSFIKLLSGLAAIPVVAKFLPETQIIPAQDGDPIVYWPAVQSADGAVIYLPEHAITMRWPRKLLTRQADDCHRYLAQKYGMQTPTSGKSCFYNPAG